jgi:enoyl-CoA hydratase/carnithine racemase
MIRIESTDGIAVVIMDRPPANALDPSFLTAGLETLEQLRSEAPGAVVLTGTAAFFCGGADLKVVPTLGIDEQTAMARDVNRLFLEWYGFPRPVVCAVNGHAVAGGLVLALCGDHRVVGSSGRFGLTEVKVGIPYPPSAMAVVRGELTPAAARRLVLRGELFNSRTATELGVFDERVTHKQVLPRALAVAAEMRDLPPQTFEIVKRSLRRSVLKEAEDRRPDSSIRGWVTSEAVEAAPAVLERHE